VLPSGSAASDFEVDCRFAIEFKDVASYSDLQLIADDLSHSSLPSSCRTSFPAYWSSVAPKLRAAGQRKRALTIEVLLRTKMIWRASGKRNSPPRRFEQELLERWADQERLSFPKKT
jgi:hypothetical protein